MYATALKEYGKKLKVKKSQEILSDQMKIKFGPSPSDEKRIFAQTDSDKLDKALHSFATAKTREEVLKCLD